MTDRLRPGVALFDVPGHGPALRTADGTLLDVGLAPERVDAVHAYLAEPAGDPPAELAAFAEAGHLGAAPAWPADRRTVVVLGPQVLADALSRAGAAPVRHDSTDPAHLLALRPAAVCALHDGPAPPSWAALDVLAAHGIAWLRVAVEGRHALIEPVAAAPGDVGHADVRARRLAAAGSGHRHLAAYWASHGPRPGGLDPADLALVAALAAADLRAWAVGAPEPAPGPLVGRGLPRRRRLRVVDLDTAAITDHPVLPVPPCAP